MAFQGIKGYRKTTTTSAQSVTIDLTKLGQVNGNQYQAKIIVKTDDVVVKLGTALAAATADTTLTSDAFADGNIVYAAGTIEFIQIPPSTTHFSVKALGGTGTGTIDFVIGYGEKI